MTLLLLGIVFVGYGVSSVITYLEVGGIVLRSGTVVHGLPALLVAILSTAFGIASLALFVRQRSTDSKMNFQVGKHRVMVTCKNKTLGAIHSLTLQFENRQQATFYCSAEKVASSLLDDFEIGKEAMLVIKKQNGRDCELNDKRAYAHGMITK